MRRSTLAMLYLAVVLLPTMLFGQCLTTVRKDVAPATTQGDAELRNPLAMETATPLRVVAIGDSVMWGNGDRPGHKLVDLVVQMVADKTHRSVQLTSFAHSAALASGVIGASMPEYNGAPLADLNFAQPSSEVQAGCAATATRVQGECNSAPKRLGRKGLRRCVPATACCGLEAITNKEDKTMKLHRWIAGFLMLVSTPAAWCQMSTIGPASKAQTMIFRSYTPLASIPAGTTSYMIEGWGTGGQGGSNTGGQGGGYFKAILPAAMLKGGCEFRFESGMTSANCQDSMTTPKIVMRFNAYNGAAGGSGLGGGFSSSVSGIALDQLPFYFSGQQGQAGSTMKVPGMMLHATVGTLTTIIVSANGGDGGDGAASPATHGSGGWTPWVMQNNGTFIRYSVGATAANMLSYAPTPGAEPGGGGGALAGLDGKGMGAAGGAGRIVVTYCGSAGC